MAAGWRSDAAHSLMALPEHPLEPDAGRALRAARGADRGIAELETTLRRDHVLHKVGGGDDRDAAKRIECEQIAVTGDEHTGLVVDGQF